MKAFFVARIFLILILILIVLATAWRIFHRKTFITSTLPNSQELSSNNKLSFPINEFKERINKKPFGIFVTPNNSPVQPERFTGYHTASDIEYQDVIEEVPIYAVGDGKIVLSRTASGYGGVFVLNFNLPDGSNHTAIYGHIRPNTLPAVGLEVKKDQQLGVLGTGYTAETDGERHHLHFGIRADNIINILGYVQNQTELSGWIDPVTLY